MVGDSRIRYGGARTPTSLIFISHSSKDTDAARALKNDLDVWGFGSVFLDFDPEDGIPTGRAWERELYDKLRTCRAMIILCSLDSMASKWCFAEVTHARARGKAVFPLRISDCEVFPVLKNIQVLDIFPNRTMGIQRLQHDLQRAGLQAPKLIWHPERAPYPGLATFEEDDAGVFFGRELEIQELSEVIRRTRDFGGSRLLLVVGPSGIGKSSLLRAGLLPQLRRSDQAWHIVGPVIPREDPLTSLIDTIEGSGSHDNAPIENEFDATNSTSALVFKIMSLNQKNLEARGTPDATTLLFIDQFEEALVAGVHDGVINNSSNLFMSTIRELVMNDDYNIIVVAVLRSDFLPDFQRDSSLGTVVTKQFMVGPLTVDGIARTIIGPADLAEIEFEPGLVQEMIQDAGSADSLPLLAYTLHELWLGYGEDNKLTLDEYRNKLGGLHQAVGKAAEAAYNQQAISGVSDQELRAAFLSLARVDDEGRYAGRQQPWDSFTPAVRQALDVFIFRHLLKSNIADGIRVVEPAHTALFHTWKRLAMWVDDSKESLLWRRRLESAARNWCEAGKPNAGLWRGSLLSEVKRRLPTGLSVLPPTETMFVLASRLSEKKRRIAWRITQIAIPLAIVLIILGWQRSIERSQVQTLFETGEASALLSLAGESDKYRKLLRNVALYLSKPRSVENDATGLGMTAWMLDYVSQAASEDVAEDVTSLRSELLAVLHATRAPPPDSQFEWVDIPDGRFLMGDENADGSNPEHWVEVSSFRMLAHELTRQKFAILFPTRAGAVADSLLPATDVTWYEAYLYSAWVGGRLPTESEWEFAARFGCEWEFCDRRGEPIRLDSISWHRENYPEGVPETNRPPLPVGQLEPNPLGLYDMIGNVWEWVADWYEYEYPSGEVIDPWGPITGDARVLRGASYWDGPSGHTAVHRYFGGPKKGASGIGFRIVLPAR